MREHTVRIGRSIPKSVQSAWHFALCILVIIKIFEKIVDAFFLHAETIYLVSFGIFALLYAIATGGIFLRQKWGLALAVYATVLDLLVTSYTGGIYSTSSVIVGILVWIAAFFVYRYSFDK